MRSWEQDVSREGMGVVEGSTLLKKAFTVGLLLEVLRISFH